MNQEILERRLMNYAKRCLLLGRDLYALQFIDSKHLAGQLIRSGSHPGIHYGEARAAQSRCDYIHKLSVLLKELRESRNTIVIANMMEYYPPEKLTAILAEGNELIAIFTATVKKLKDNPKG